MSTKAGYKIVLTPGDELLAILQNTRSERRELPSMADNRAPKEAELATLSPEELEATSLLKEHGVIPSKASKLVASFGPEVVCETVEYLSEKVIEGGRKNVENPAGLIIYSLENSLPVPASFMSSRKRRAAEDAVNRKRIKEQRLMQEQIAYSEWLDEQQDRAVREQYSEGGLELKVDELSGSLARRDERVRRMTEKARKDLAYRMLRKEIASQAQLPSFEEWRRSAEQTRLF
jgi:hypothetical protein